MKKKTWTQPKYNVPSYIYRALQLLRPPEHLTVSEWAAKYRRLDSKTSAMPGIWLNERTPYLAGVMDELVNYETELIIFCAGSQLGKTECANNMVGYAIHTDPSPMLIVYPTNKLAESISENRLVPMIRTSPALRRLWHPLESEKLELQFDGMYLSLVGSESPSGLASKAIKYLFMDEVDKYPGSLKNEADPISLARERTKTFANRKIYMTSTPTVREGRITQAMEQADCVKHYFVPCPHCGKMIELQFKQLKWPDGEGLTSQDRADQAVYICQECGGAITDRHKGEMLRNGEWREVISRSNVHRVVAFHLSTLYSPFVRFSEMALEWLNSQNDREKLQNFVNSWLGEPWEDETLHTDADTVLERRTELPEFVVPNWARMLTGGVDVQMSSFYWAIRAFGDNVTSQCIAYGQVANWADIERIMDIEYVREDGESMIVNLVGIDCNFKTDETFDFYVRHADWVVPVRGSANDEVGGYKFFTINRETGNPRANGMRYAQVYTNHYKTMIAARMLKKNGEPGCWMVHADTDREYARQVTAEHKVNIKRAGRTVEVWQQKGSADNHYLDCEVYALAAADILGVRTLHLLREEPVGTSKAPEEKPRINDWFQDTRDWLGDVGKWL